MDQKAELSVLENEQKVIEQYLDHPISRKILADNEAEQQACITLILESPVVDIQTFLAREQALGHLRGLRRGQSIVTDDLEEIKLKIKDTN